MGALLADLEGLVRPPRSWPWAAIGAAALAAMVGVGVTYTMVRASAPPAPPDAGPQSTQEMAFELARVFLQENGVEGALQMAERLEALDRRAPNPPPDPPGPFPPGREGGSSFPEGPDGPLERSILGNRAELAECLEGHPDRGSVVLLEVVIDDEGEVEQVEITHSDAPAEVASCLAGEVIGWQVGEPGEDGRRRSLAIPLDLLR